jgi:hypothetical protein
MSSFMSDGQDRMVPAARDTVAPSTAHAPHVAFFIVTDGSEGSHAFASPLKPRLSGEREDTGGGCMGRLPCAAGLPRGARYTRDSARSLLLLLGIKPRIAVKIAAVLFAALEGAALSAMEGFLASGGSSSVAADPTCPFKGGRGEAGTPSGITAVHMHRVTDGTSSVSLTRAQFSTLLSECAAQFNYRIGAPDELRVAYG